MRQAKVDPATGLERIREDRAVRDVADALPRQPWGEAVQRKSDGTLGSVRQTWTVDWLEWRDGVLACVRCWKCGREIRKWRRLLDRHGNGVAVRTDEGVLPAAAFLLLPIYRCTYFDVYNQALEEIQTVKVLHCADCQIRSEDGAAVIGCYLCGRQAERWQAKTLGQAMDPHAWASYCYRWKFAEPVGPQPRPEGAPAWRA